MAMPAMSKVLIVEDQPAVAKALTVLFEMNEIECASVSGAEQALAAVAGDDDVAVVVQDMNFSAGATSGAEGIDLFRRLRLRDPELPVLVLTAWTSLETAVQMVKEGASDYLAKPWDDAKLLATVRNLLTLRELRIENRRLRAEGARSFDELAARYDLRGMRYRSAAMHRAVSLAAQVAAADVPVLITGPHGAGKEMIAEIIQANSRRRGGPFVKVNAGAIPDELLESELFGAEPGAYTGAQRRRLGRFEAADGGTLFLDEIGNLSAAGQMKLLRVLQSGEFERLGSNQTLRVDVRVLAATNARLRDEIARGRFREDLFYRLNVIEVSVPGLRDRPEDILPLAEEFLRALAAPGRQPATLSAAARTALLEHAWPGNVRELMNRIQRATLVAAASELTPQDLGLGVAIFAAGTEDEDERGRIEQALRESEGSVSRAAVQLGLSRQALYRKMEKLGIVLERRPRS